MTFIRDFMSVELEIQKYVENMQVFSFENTSYFSELKLGLKLYEWR